MKPKTLKFPFRWEERRPIFSDDVLYLPKCYEGHQAWCKEEVWTFFSQFSAVAVEYGSGNGIWIATKAEENPETLWIGVEKRFDRVQRIWAKKHNLGLKNLFVVCGEALTFTKYYLQEGKIDRVYVNFPDPWPKLKHAKNRLLQKPFPEEMKRVTKEGAEAIFATDDAPYCFQMIREMVRGDLWKPVFPSPHYITDWPSYGASYFQELWKSRGKVIHYMKFLK